MNEYGDVDMLRPLHDRILVRRVESEEQTASGLYIPDAAQEKPQQGKVVGVGRWESRQGRKRIALDVKEGDTILFGKYSGQEVRVDGEDYLIMREDEVLAIVGAQ
jgi:chaperonin GroES